MRRGAWPECGAMWCGSLDTRKGVVRLDVGCLPKSVRRCGSCTKDVAGI